MVKIKDFTLDSQNLGGGALAPPPRGLHTGRPCFSLIFVQLSICARAVHCGGGVVGLLMTGFLSLGGFSLAFSREPYNKGLVRAHLLNQILCVVCVRRR